MASKHILVDTVFLYNYVGEVNDEASYQVTKIERCYCPLKEGADLVMQGHKANDSARLYVFDRGSIAKDTDGTVRSYLPYDEWKQLDDKSHYWTLNDKGNDYFEKAGSNSRLRITRFSHKVAGSKRMWHFEVDGR